MNNHKNLFWLCMILVFPIIGGAQINTTLTGSVKTDNGDAIAGVEVTLFDNQGNTVESYSTGADGQYVFNNLTIGQEYGVILYNSNDAPLNGVSTFDAVLCTRHILGMAPLGSPYKILAADVNNSQTLTTFDVVSIRRLILGITQNLDVPAWRFIPADYTFPNPLNPFQGTIPGTTTVTIDGNQQPLNFIGMKSADVNNSAITH